MVLEGVAIFLLKKKKKKKKLKSDGGTNLELLSRTGTQNG